MKSKRALFLTVGISILGLSSCGRSAPPIPQVNYVPTERACAESWVQMPMRIGFPTSGASMSYQDREILRQMVLSASERDDLMRVRVEGHTDTCGNEANNVELSRMRAQSVASELITMGVPPERVDTIGYGSQRPIADETCRTSQPLSTQANRRVEFSLLVCR